MEPLNLTAVGSAVAVHPSVLFSILDQHIRRMPEQDRVIGVLLGTVSGGVVDVTNSFGVLHVRREDEVLVRRTSVNELLALHKRVNDKETVVGWYSSLSGAAAGAGGASAIDDFTLAVHSFFEDFAPRPLHLLVDVSLATPHIGVQAYVAMPNNLVKNTLFTFQALRTSIATTPEERVGLDAMLRPAHTRDGAVPVPAEVQDVAGELDALESSMRRLKRLLDAVLAAVDDVVAGRRPADESVGRGIAEALAAVPRIDAAAFERAFNTSLQDLLMVTYLANLTLAQLKIAERITTSVHQV